MCGIFGYLDTGVKPESEVDKIIQNGIIGIKRRGPDNTGKVTYSSGAGNLTLVHSRLAIIDLDETANQPMTSQCGRWAITYNGEIYNYLELRSALEESGYHFVTNSDTEVLLTAWIEWGKSAFERMNGMFALAIYDRTEQKVTLARDRFGVKPLYYATSEGLVFSSSVAAVAHVSRARPNVDYCARGLYYRVFEQAGGDSPFEDVMAVEPGNWVEFSVSEKTLSRTSNEWYSLEKAVNSKKQEIEGLSTSDLASLCLETLRDAVRVRLRSDVPFAVSLSGGLDSTTVASLVCEQEGRLKGFTYGDPGAKSSEGPLVERFSKEKGIDVEYIWPGNDETSLRDALDTTFVHQEAPFTSLSVMAQNRVFQYVSQAGYKVLLGGQGGDEIFAGYRKFFIVAMKSALHRKSVGDSLHMVYSLGLMLLCEARQMSKYLNDLSRYRSDDKPGFQILDWVPPELNLWGDPDTGLLGRQISDVKRFSIPSLLRYEDRNSMGYGLETRLPFMDYRLVELALALPDKMKIAKGHGKWALRRISQGQVPDYIRLNRMKRGFDVTQNWVEGGVGAALIEKLQDSGEGLSYAKDKQLCQESLSVDAMARNEKLLGEALMLAWLDKPIQIPGIK